MSSEIATPYDAEIARLEALPIKYILHQATIAIHRAKQEGYLLGYAAGDAAHACCEPGCPCHEAGRVAEAEEPSVSGRQT